MHAARDQMKVNVNLDELNKLIMKHTPQMRNLRENKENQRAVSRVEIPVKNKAP